MKVEKRLLKYIAIKTPCDENSDTVPTDITDHWNTSPSKVWKQLSVSL